MVQTIIRRKFLRHSAGFAVALSIAAIQVSDRLRLTGQGVSKTSLAPLEQRRSLDQSAKQLVEIAVKLPGGERLLYLRTAFEQLPEIEDNLELAELYLKSALEVGSPEDAQVARDYLLANRRWLGNFKQTQAGT